eukprot:Skav221103  [mRNA]  locus=scaffold693:292855:297402:- [translate_table: standard]
MQELFVKCTLDHHTFADHSIITGTFRDPDPPAMYPIWRRPQALHWNPDNQAKFRRNTDPPEPDGCSEGGGPCRMTAGVQTWKTHPEGEGKGSLEGTLTHRYHAIWQAYEDQVDQFQKSQELPGLTDEERGRANTLHRTWIKQQHFVIKPARSGEPTTLDPRPNYQVKHWIIQLRRLVNLERLVTSTENARAGRTVHMLSLWGAIKRAKGFTPSFSAWWKIRLVQGGDAPGEIPESMPGAEAITQIRQVMEDNATYLQHKRIKDRVSIMNARYTKDTNQVFKDVKATMASPVESLLDTAETKVVDVPEADTVVVEGHLHLTTDFRELGGHLQTTRRRTNRTLMDKVQTLDAVWQRLAISRAPRSHKLRVIRMKAWPCAFHSAPIANVNDKQYTHMRAGAVKALKLHKSGANSQLFLALCCHPQHDPECYTLMLSVRLARQYILNDYTEAFLEHLHVQPERQRNPGPLGLLLSRLELVDASTSCRWVKQFDEAERTMLQVLQIGTFVSGDQQGKAHQEDESEWKCKFCGEPDSLDHRWWRCSETQWSRDQLPPETVTWIDQQADCTKLRGWYCHQPEVADFQRVVARAPAEVCHGRFLANVQTPSVYIFTDGAGKDPTQPQSRLVAWAWCYVTEIGVDAVLFCDNLGIVNRARAFQDPLQEVEPNMKDGDLWGRFQALATATSNKWTFIHVYSHQDVHPLDTLDAWICKGNECADRVASQMLQSFSEPVLRAQGRASRVFSQTTQWYHELLQHMVRIAKQSVKVADPVTHEPSLRPIVEPVDLTAVVTRARQSLPVTIFGDWVEEWLGWLQSVEDPTVAPRWVSWLELLLHFQITHQKPGLESAPLPGRTQRHWRPVSNPTTQTQKQLARSFGSCDECSLPQATTVETQTEETALSQAHA